MSALLVVDGDAQTRERLVAGLTGCGFAVVAASDGLAALDLVGSHTIDAIVLELKLPQGDGISLIPLIRRITHAPIVMVSQRLDLATRIAALAAGADDCVTRPFDLGELAARIKSALRRHVSS
jgi:DNA-binding response OmpR family regulator